MVEWPHSGPQARRRAIAPRRAPLLQAVLTEASGERCGVDVTIIGRSLAGGGSDCVSLSSPEPAIVAMAAGDFLVTCLRILPNTLY